MTKHWYQSKTKVGSLLIGGSLVFGGIGGYLTGGHDANTMMLQVGQGLGIITVVFGIRDALQ